MFSSKSSKKNARTFRVDRVDVNQFRCSSTGNSAYNRRILLTINAGRAVIIASALPNIQRQQGIVEITKYLTRPHWDRQAAC